MFSIELFEILTNIDWSLMITIFISYTGYKAYMIYEKQIEQSKMQQIIDLQFEIQKLTREFNSKNSESKCNHTVFKDSCNNCRLETVHFGNLLSQGAVMYYELFDTPKLKKLYQEFFDELFANIEENYLKGFPKNYDSYMIRYKTELYQRKPNIKISVM